MNEPQVTHDKPPFSTALMVLICLSIYGLMSGFMFGVAGRIDLPWVWATMSVFSTAHMTCLIVIRRDSGLIRERLKPGPGAPLWDRILLSLLAVVFLANMLVTPLDVGRFHWSDKLPFVLHMMGLVATAIGMAITTWAMAVNTFFSKVVRIQSERGHRVVSSGPYRFVRHPGYVGITLMWIGFHLAIGSWLGVAVAAIVVILLVYRTAKEDQLLIRELDGYEEYANNVRWRLVPRIW